MPRPRKLKSAKVVPIVFEGEVYERLKRVATAQGLSVSELVRRLACEYLAQTGELTEASVPADPPSSDPVDPLEQLEAEEFFNELERLEKEVEELDKVVKAIASKGGSSALKPHLDHFRRQAWRKIERWHSLRRLYARCRNAVPPQKRMEGAERLAKVKRTLNALLELLR